MYVQYNIKKNWAYFYYIADEIYYTFNMILLVLSKIYL